MPQDQGPIGEPQISRVDQALHAHNLDDLTQKTEGLREDVKIAIDNVGLDAQMLMRKWKGENSWEELKGKKVLDLASGSALGKIQWNPYFSRLCAYNGASVTAVDILPRADPDQKLFRGVTADLVSTVMKAKLAEILGNESFDVIHSYSFVGFNPSPDLLEKLDKVKITEKDFRQALLEQSFGLLSEGGIISLDEKDYGKGEFVYYTKREGKLVRL